MNEPRHADNVKAYGKRSLVHLAHTRYNHAEGRMGTYTACNPTKDVQGPRWHGTAAPATCKRCLKTVKARLNWQQYPGQYDNVTRWAATDAQGRVHAVTVVEGSDATHISVRVNERSTLCVLADAGMPTVEAAKFACERFASENQG